MRDANNRHVLFVGDVATSRETAPVLETLESDVEVTAVAAAHEALDRLDGDGTFDCVVSEYELTDEDGLSLLKSVRETSEAIPYILERPDAEDGVIEDAIAAGVTDFYLSEDADAAGMTLKNRVETAIDASANRRDGRTILHDVCRMSGSTAEIVTVVDGSGTIRSQCPASADVLGYESEALVGETFSSFVHPEDRDRVRSTTAALLERQSATTDRVEFRIRHADGSWRWLDAIVSNTPQDGGEGSVLISRDVTQRVEYERELERQRELLRHTEDLADTGGWEADLETGTQRWTRGTRRLHEVSDDFEPTVDEGIDFFHPEDRETIAEKVSRCAEEGESYDVELRLVTARGDLRWVRAVGVPVREGGKITGLRGAIRDVTRRRTREERLRRYEEAVENSGHAVFITDTDGTVEYVNPAFEEVTGYSATEALGASPSILASGEMDEGFFEDLWETILDGETWEGEIVNRRADGDLYYAEQTIAPIHEDGVPSAFVAVQRDVTARRERERALERARRQLRAIIDLIPDPIFLKNRDGEYVFANKAHAAVYGETPEAVEGKTDFELDVPQATASRFGKEDRTVIENGRAERIEGGRVRTASGEERVFETIKIPYELEPEDETAVLGYARDITDLKEQERVLESQRDDLEVLNQMVRHDIRNDLQLVRSYVAMLDGHVDDEAEDYIEIVRERTEKAVELTRTARELAELLLHEGTEPRSTSLDEPITEQVEALRSSFPEADVRVELPIASTTVVADEMVEAVVRNLLQNAVYHNDKETPVVSVSTEERADAVRVAVADNGPGVPDSHKDEIFGQGEKGLESDGTGIGLYLVKTLVGRYDGDVWIEDNDPEGSVFVVEFPKAD